jgi:hypothetical protein
MLNFNVVQQPFKAAQKTRTCTTAHSCAPWWVRSLERVETLPLGPPGMYYSSSSPRTIWCACCNSTALWCPNVAVLMHYLMWSWFLIVVQRLLALRVCVGWKGYISLGHPLVEQSPARPTSTPRMIWSVKSPRQAKNFILKTGSTTQPMKPRPHMGIGNVTPRWRYAWQR